MKKRYQVMQVVSANSSIHGCEFKTVTLGGSKGTTAWSGPAIFDNEDDAEKFIEDGLPGATRVGYYDTSNFYHNFVIVKSYQVENPDYKSYSEKFPIAKPPVVTP